MKTVRLSHSGELVYRRLYGTKGIIHYNEGSAAIIAEVPDEDYDTLMRLVREEEYACNLRMLESGLSPIYPWIEFPIEGHARHCSCRACMSGSCGCYNLDLFEDSILWKD